MGVGAVEAETAARRLLGLDRSGVTSAAEAVPAALRDPWAQKLDADNDDELLMFMSFPSARDPSCATRFPNKSTACIITTAYPETFARFYDAARGDAKGANQSQKRKNAEYDRLKQALQAKLLKGLYKHFPKCEGHVKYIDVATPLTNVYYLGRPDSYALARTNVPLISHDLPTAPSSSHDLPRAPSSSHDLPRSPVRSGTASSTRPRTTPAPSPSSDRRPTSPVSW